jgi:4-hydroxybenzoate polyprenyltransferase
MSSNGSVAGLTSRPGKIADYIAIMRLDHATKHVFVAPGIILALLLRGSQVQFTVWPFIAGALIASVNYVINKWLDRDFDALHPTKSARTAVQIRLDGSVV